jgi:hypothetical protein
MTQDDPKTGDRSMLDIALHWAARGFRVFPVHTNGKLPAVGAWPLRATTDEATIRRWWSERDPVLNVDRISDKNVAIYTGGHLVVDVDVKRGGLGEQSLREITTFDELPRTLTIRTPTGGSHLIFSCASGAATTASKLGPGLDTRGEGGYVVAAGSTIDGVPYRVIDDAPIAEAPQWIVEAVGAPVAKADKGAVVSLVDMPQALERARTWLKDQAPGAVVGARGSTAYRVAAKVKDFGVSALACLELMAEHWNEVKAEPPMEYDDMAASVEHAYRYGNKPVGIDNPTADFEAVKPEEIGDVDDVPMEKAKPRAALFYKDPIDVAPDYNRVALVEDLLDTTAFVVMYGDSNVGKTFVAMMLSYCVATGLPFAGRKVKERVVVYVAAEAGHSAERRIQALKMKFGRERFNVLLVPCPVDLLRPTADTGPLIELVKEIATKYGEVGMVVIDTLSRAMAGGNENGPEDMGAFVKNIDRIRVGCAATTLLIHHTGKDAAKGARGHSLLRAATDTEIEVADGVIRATKQRDMEMGKGVTFGLETVVLGKREDGKDVTSAVVDFSFKPTFDDAEPLGNTEIVVLQALVDVGGSVDKTSTDVWREEAERAYFTACQKPLSRTNFNNVVTRLTRKARVEKIATNQWLTK